MPAFCIFVNGESLLHEESERLIDDLPCLHIVRKSFLIFLTKSVLVVLLFRAIADSFAPLPSDQVLILALPKN